MRDGHSLRGLAQECRQRALHAPSDVSASLNEIALDYDRQADRVDKAEARVRERLANRPPLNGE
jgi:hypothetical protein